MSSIVHIGRRSDSIIYVKTIFKFTYFKTTHTHIWNIHHYISTYIIYIYLQGLAPNLPLGKWLLSWWMWESTSSAEAKGLAENTERHGEPLRTPPLFYIKMIRISRNFLQESNIQLTSTVSLQNLLQARFSLVLDFWKKQQPYSIHQFIIIRSNPIYSFFGKPLGFQPPLKQWVSI